MSYQNYYHYSDKPFLLNTQSRWKQYGYTLRKNAPVRSELKTDRRKQRYPLYHAEDIRPIPGKAAMHRRYMQMLAHFRSQINKLLLELVQLKPTITPDELHDYASALVDEGYARYDCGSWAENIAAYRPQVDYFIQPYFVNEHHVSQVPEVKPAPAPLNEQYQKRLLNTTLDFTFEAIDAGYYHDQAAAKRTADAERQRKEALEAELVRLCIASVPVHALNDWEVEWCIQFSATLDNATVVQIDHLVNPERYNDEPLF